MAWTKSFSHISETLSCIGSKFLRYNNSIKTGNTSCNFNKFSEKIMNDINQLINVNENLKNCEDFKRNLFLMIIYCINSCN